MQTVKNYYHLVQAILATTKLGQPARDLVIIGVTGTDGKTTTAHLIYHLLVKTGHKAALISTVAAYIGNQKFDTGFHVSTPSPRELQEYLLKAKKMGMTYVVLEVTSHALDQHRVYGIPFKVGVLTNITRDHLDYHKTMQHYIDAKTKLFLASQSVVLNQDDGSYISLSKKLAHKKVITYGLTKTADVNPHNHLFKSTMSGEFNTYNTLAALAVCDDLGIDPQKAASAVSSFELPEGRFDIVYQKEFTVIIDFAHTPNGLKSILKAVREEHKKSNIIHVFGSAGQRDKGKRPLMGKISSEVADTIILTSEDPRDESPESIAEDIKKGMSQEPKNVRVITDRQQAINEAVTLARKGDVVVITGKGHEKSMNSGQGEVPWSEHEAVAKALNELRIKN